MHQLVAEAFIGPCPSGHKLVHLNGNYLDNRRANLAYIPESDPRPAAPLKPRLPGWFTKTVALEPRQRAGSRSQPTGKRGAKVRGSTAKKSITRDARRGCHHSGRGGCRLASPLNSELSSRIYFDCRTS